MALDPNEDLRRIDFYTTHPQYVEHVEPIWNALPADRRGFWVRTAKVPPPSRRLTLVASYGNLITVRRSGRRCAYIEHGAGFTYQDGGNPFAGGKDRGGVAVFLDLNEDVRQRNRLAHPEIPGFVVGTPKLDRVFVGDRRQGAGIPPSVAFSFHWDYARIPEARSALPHYRRRIADLARRLAVEREPEFRLLGHGHPRIAGRMRAFWLNLKVPYIRDFPIVLERADLYVVDSSSTAYEFATTGRPVLLLNAPWYRRDVDHGLRFWRHIPGLEVDEPTDLEDAIRLALADPAEWRAKREAAVATVYPIRDGSSAARAAAVLVETADRLA